MTDLTEIWSAQQLADFQKRKKATARGAKSKALHEKFAFDCRARGLPAPRHELKFALEMLERRWSFDFAFAEYMVAVELEGLVILPMYTKAQPGAKRMFICMGRHASPEGIKGDMEKYNAATLLGWSVLRFEQDAIKSSVAVDTTLSVLHARGWRP